MDNDVSNAHLGHVQRLVRARTMQQGARVKKSGPVAEGAANNIQPLALQPQLMHVCFIQLQLMHRHDGVGPSANDGRRLRRFGNRLAAVFGRRLSREWLRMTTMMMTTMMI